MNAGDIYRRAAERVFVGENKASCVAVLDAVQEGRGSLISQRDTMRVYSELFCPTFALDPYWGSQWNDDVSSAYECRTLALCLMAAIAESEEQS